MTETKSGIDFSQFDLTRIHISLPDILMIARSVHEANRSWCIRNRESFIPNHWDECSAEQQCSILNGVIFQLERVREPSDPSASHRNWMKFKLLAGWKYGEVKDEEKKTHPCLVSFEELPKESQFKDALFESLVRVLELRLRNLGKL